MITKQSDVDWPTVLKTLGGGATLGAGIGTGTSLARYLHTLNAKAKASKNPHSDEDVLYLNLPAKKASHPANNAATFALSSLAGLGGTYGAYTGVRGMYSKLRKKQLEKEILAAQQTYIDSLNQQTAKEAKHHGQFSGITKAVGSGYLAALLTVLGSGIVTNKVLQKQFPSTKSPERNYLKKVVIRTMPSPDEAKPVSPDANENILRQNLANDKVASASGLRDLVCAVAQGRGDELKNLLEDNIGSSESVNLLFDTVKGASLIKSSSLNRNLAITWLVTDPMLSPIISTVSAAEYYGWVPHCKVASFVDPEWHNDLIGLTESITQETRRAIYAPLLSKLDPGNVKAATSILSNPIASKFIVAQAIHQMLHNNQPAPQAVAPPSGTSASTSDDSQETLQQPGQNNPSFEVDDQDASDFLQNNKDVVDQALTPAGI